MVDVVSTLGRDMDKLDHGGGHRANNAGSQERDLSVYDPSVAINVTCVDAVQPGGPGTLRHHHNFDQIRMTLSGVTTYDRQRVAPGDLQYVPESTDYGPQARQEGGRRLFVFQFPGQSLRPFFTYKSAFVASAEMKQQGVKFVDGLAIFPDGRKQDGYESVWEHIAGRKIDYAPRRYGDPLYFYTDAYEWEPTDVRGVSVKEFGRFNVYGPNLGSVKLDAGASIPTKPVNWMQFRVVVSGEVECAGKVCPQGSRIYEGPGSGSLSISGRSEATLLTVQIGYRGKTDPAPMHVI
jgi:hypothetical protein